MRDVTLATLGFMPVSEAVASSAVKTAIDVGARMLVVLTESGRTARMVSKYRPQQPILVLTSSAETTRQVAGAVRGCKCVTVCAPPRPRGITRALLLLTSAPHGAPDGLHDWLGHDPAACCRAGQRLWLGEGERRTLCCY